jgi:hypothetical protein
MKTKLVLWGTNAEEKKVLIAIGLRALENKIDIYTFPEEIVTEAFGKQLMDEWRLGEEVAFPEGYAHIEKELSMTEGLLPEDIKVSRGDLVQRAQTEWHFVVLSAKLNQAYQSEYAELKEKIEQLNSYDSATWNSLKEFWNKVQGQVRDKNLFREHANTLRDGINDLFSKLKELRHSMDEEFHKTSDEHFKKFASTLEDIETRVKEGMNLTVIFDELKRIQREFKDTKFTREHRSKLWQRIDGAFKNVKEKRFGNKAYNDSSPLDRIQKRYDGLLNAINKMENSIRRDKDDLSFQNHKIEKSEGQLEAQIRQAKIKMIEERISSKNDKHEDMLKTKAELERKIESLKAKEAKQKEIEAAKAAAKEKIAADIEAQKANLSDDEAEKLEKAAEALKDEGSPKDTKSTESTSDEKEDSLFGAIGTTMGEALTDVVDTIKAVAEVIGDRIEDKVDEIREEMSKEEE